MVRELVISEAPAAAALLARGMRDNPIHIAALGPDAAHRRAALASMFEPVLAGSLRVIERANAWEAQDPAGFDTVGGAKVLGVPNWFMLRPIRAAHTLDGDEPADSDILAA